MIPIINFDQCFQFINKEEIFQYFYQNCKQSQNFEYKESLYTMPNYLIIILDRRKVNIFNYDVLIPEQFNISNYVENKNSFDEIYELIGLKVN